MEHTTHLWLFFILVFGIVLLPGMDMAFVVAKSIAGGRATGLAAVAGIATGGVCHVAMGATGVSMVLRLFPSAFNALLILGALYVAWIGFTLMARGAALQAAPQSTVGAPSTTFRQGLITNLLNPKAYLFMLAVFPQFYRPAYGPLWIQALILGGIISATLIGVYGSVALLVARAHSSINLKPAAYRLVTKIIGFVLILAAAFTGMEGWRDN